MNQDKGLFNSRESSDEERDRKVSCYPVAPEARTSRESDVADVGRSTGGNRFINHQSSILQGGASGRLHLPELLELLHNVHCNEGRES